MTSGILLGSAAVNPLWLHWASAQELARQQVIRYASNHEDIKSMDPMAETNTEEYMISRLMHEGLVAFPPGNDFALDNLQPGLAERWETSADGKTWTFFLRSGVVFHKGFGELSAEDVKFTYDRIRDPKLGSSHRGRYANIQEVRVLDKRTVRFSLASLDIL
ncbi:MAG: polyamine ABC transporter substrate-binding protein, partial [Candidatus Tectomicrobia bacterium]|nr:polyamine ABC transporter substrate-binding protein [Candidatus Tectomicrobia bacterium]